MSIVNFSASQPAANTRSPFAGLTSVGGTNAERPKAKVWMNIGYVIGDKFINLPVGLPIDTMEAADVRGQNEDWVKQRNAQNDFLKNLQAVGASMAPGEERDIITQEMGGITLVVRLRRVNEQMEIAKENNEYAVDLSNLFSKPAVLQPAAE